MYGFIVGSDIIIIVNMESRVVMDIYRIEFDDLFIRFYIVKIN